MYLIIYNNNIKQSEKLSPEHYREAKSGLITIINTKYKTVYHNEKWRNIPVEEN